MLISPRPKRCIDWSGTWLTSVGDPWAPWVDACGEEYRLIQREWLECDGMDDTEALGGYWLC